MKIFIKPPPHVSQAMFRVERALQRFAPPWVEIVLDPKKADLAILHVIGSDAITAERPTERYAVIQYCIGPGHPCFYSGDWQEYWRGAEVVWSYYDYEDFMPDGAEFYLAPLGIDDAFLQSGGGRKNRELGCVTSGYVTGPGAEAIEEVALAAHACGLAVAHLGPPPEYGNHSVATKLLDLPLWSYFNGISDVALSTLYQNSRWVSGLRHVEGFELPCVEGLACGAFPIVFDRPDMHFWYDGRAVFVPECSGEELVKHLIRVFQSSPPKGLFTREHNLEVFSWKRIVEGFYQRLSAALQVGHEEATMGR